MGQYSVTIRFNVQGASTPEQAVKNIIRYVDRDGISQCAIDVTDEAGNSKTVDANSFSLEELFLNGEEADTTSMDT